MNAIRLLFVVIVVAIIAALTPPCASAAEAKESSYRGWKTLELKNDLIEVQLAPDIGGRIIQFKLKDFEYLWVNEQLAGKTPPPTGLGPKSEWLNYGGDKLWPAPQGWDNDQQWPGPPGPIIEGIPHTASIVTAKGTTASIQHTSPQDKSTGIQFSRIIKVPDGVARVSLVSTMKNISSKPRRWGIWEVTQLSCADRKGPGYDKDVWAYCPINPKSLYPKGYKVMFGAADNPAFKLDFEKKMMGVHYERQVGKIGLDSMAGWLAVVRQGHAFVERFTCFPDQKYPDDASVEFWIQAPGKFVAAGKENVITDDPKEAPPYMETEVLSPFAELKPGDSYTFRNDWYVTNIGGNYPILDCTPVGVVVERAVAMPFGESLHLYGRFGVFYTGTVGVAVLDASGKEVSRASLKKRVSPAEPFVLGAVAGDYAIGLPSKVLDKVAEVLLFVSDNEGNYLGELARMPRLFSDWRVRQ